MIFGETQIEDLILTRAAMLSTLSNTEMLKREADLYLHPPTEEIGMFDWRAIDRAVEIGYRYAVEKIGEWMKNTGRTP